MCDSIILASASLRRQQLLAQIGLNFIVEPSYIEETINHEMDFGQLVANIAYQKAAAVARNHRRGIILGADTIVVLDREIIGKPTSLEEAKKMLQSLSGRWHKVFTGLSLINADTNHYIDGFEESLVKFKTLKSSEIENYIKTGEPLDKAGAYAIQGKGALFVEKIQGDYYNIVGLPLFRLGLLLRQFNIKIL